MRFTTTLTLLLALLFAVSTPAKAVVVAPTTPAATAETTTEADALAAAAAYRASLKAMTPAERRALKKEQRKQLRDTLKAYKQDVKAGKDADTNTILLVILAILLPPVAVLVHQGELNSKFWIALLLTLLFYLPGLIYALLVIFGNAKK